jgi:hypothetical protein
MTVYGYVRTDRDDDDDGIERQKQAVHDYCVRHGHDLLAFFSDRCSGLTEPSRRRGWRRLERLLHQSDVVVRCDRLSREYDQLVRLAGDLAVRGVRVLFANHGDAEEPVREQLRELVREQAASITAYDPDEGDACGQAAHAQRKGRYTTEPCGRPAFVRYRIRTPANPDGVEFALCRGCLVAILPPLVARAAGGGTAMTTIDVEGGGAAMTTIDVEDWHTPALAMPRRWQGRARIADDWCYRGRYEAYGTGPPGGPGYDFYRLRRKVRITELKVDGRVCMVDDCPHWWAMQAHAREYRGHVLVAGLGLGLIVHALAANPEVAGITVVERDKDVIDLVSPHLPEAPPTSVVHADWYDYRPDRPPDGVFYDLFAGDGRELVPEAIAEMIAMRRRFGDVTILIHGFHNRRLREIADAAVAAEAATEEARRSRLREIAEAAVAAEAATEEARRIMTVRLALDRKRVERNRDVEALVLSKHVLFYLPIRGLGPSDSVYPVSPETARSEAEWFGVPFSEE